MRSSKARCRASPWEKLAPGSTGMGIRMDTGRSHAPPWRSHSVCTRQVPTPRLGFSSRAMVQERDAEAKYTAQLSTESISQFHRAITKRPHIAGIAGIHGSRRDHSQRIGKRRPPDRGSRVSGVSFDAAIHQCRTCRTHQRSVECSRACESAGPGLGESGIGSGLRRLFRFG